MAEDIPDISPYVTTRVNYTSCLQTKLSPVHKDMPRSEMYSFTPNHFFESRLWMYNIGVSEYKTCCMLVYVCFDES